MAGTICCAGAFVGSALIALTEPDLSEIDRLKTVATGTLTKGFLFLHCLGVPT